MNTDTPTAREELRLGRYRILGELGRGSFATVFRAEDTPLGRQVALKVLHPALMADPEFVQRFQADARAAAALEHPHIATIYELGQAEGRLFIAMQLLPGGNLGERIATRGPLPYAEAVRIASATGAALDAAHSAGMIHRDVKPANIVFDSRDQAVLTDFGLVRAIEQSVMARSSAGGIVGTPAYLAPEVWEGQPAGPVVDIYALGCVVFEMLTGQVLFEASTAPAVMRAHYAPRRFPERWPDGVPPGVHKILEKALAPDPRARFASAGDFARALAALEPGTETQPRQAEMRNLDAAAPTRVAPQKAGDDQLRSHLIGFFELLTMALLIVVGLYLLFRGPQVASPLTPTPNKPPALVPELIDVTGGEVGGRFVPAFQVGKAEVTNEQFRSFVDNGGYAQDEYWPGAALEWRKANRIAPPASVADPAASHNPVRGLSWYEANAYVNWLTKRTDRPFGLPTALQWRKAAQEIFQPGVSAEWCRLSSIDPADFREPGHCSLTADQHVLPETRVPNVGLRVISDMPPP